MFSSWYFYTPPSFMQNLSLVDVIQIATYEPSFRENELGCNWILKFCQSHRYSLLLPIKPNDRITKGKEEAGKYWLEVLIGLHHFYEVLAVKDKLRKSNDPKESQYLNYLYKFNLDRAMANENFLAFYIYLKEFFECKVPERNIEELLADFKNTSEAFFPWLTTFGTVAELYKGQLYFTMINVLLEKIASFPPSQEFENWTVRNKRVADTNAARVAIAEYIIKARASLNEFEDKVKANTDLLTMNCVLLNVTEMMASPTPQAVVLQIRNTLDAIEKENNPQIKAGTELHFMGRDVHLGRMPVDGDTKMVVVGKRL